MQKALAALLILVLVVGIAVVLGGVYLRRDNASRVRRAQEMVKEIEGLQIGKSDYTLADAIAMKFGIAPPPYWLKNSYNRENCAAPDHLENCTYILLLNDSAVEMLRQKHASLRRLGGPEWWGNATISINKGIVYHYSFWAWYRETDGRWGGFGAGSGETLPKYEPSDVDISDSYSVRRVRMDLDKKTMAFALVTAITPHATLGERQRAQGIDFGCLAQTRGCGDICDIMPDAWKDFSQRLGHLDVEKFGPEYLLCAEPPK